MTAPRARAIADLEAAGIGNDAAHPEVHRSYVTDIVMLAVRPSRLDLAYELCRADGESWAVLGDAAVERYLTLADSAIAVIVPPIT